MWLVGLQAIEAISKISEIEHLNYWERPHKLKLYFIQRGREHSVLRHPPTTRHPTTRHPPQSLQENAIPVFWASLVQLIA